MHRLPVFYKHLEETDQAPFYTTTLLAKRKKFTVLAFHPQDKAENGRQKQKNLKTVSKWYFMKTVGDTAGSVFV